MTGEAARLRDTFVSAWNTAGADVPETGAVYTAADRARNGVELAALVELFQAESRKARPTGRWREDAERRVLTAFTSFAARTLGWSRRDIRGMLADGFSEALRAFPVQARRFDPSLSSADIYQAARNALTAYCLQSLLGLRVELTPAVLGYSLLYPYTDNLLDDSGLDRSEKLAFGARLGDRLLGQAVAPRSRREARIFELVGMIEQQHPRRRSPRVHESLLDIHEAQLRSLALLAGSAPPDDLALIEIAVEKGGTSVLADGYLVAGTLTPGQAECIYGLGAFLQLRDDLEDVLDDGAAGVTTAFSARRSQGLDEPTARALAVGAAVLERLPCFDSPRARPARDIMARSLQLTIADAAASFPSLYSGDFLRALERRSPFGFDCLAGQRRRLSRASGTLTTLLERWIREEADRCPRARPVMGYHSSGAIRGSALSV